MARGQDIRTRPVAPVTIRNLISRSSPGKAPTSHDPALLLETGDVLLLETGDRLLLES